MAAGDQPRERLLEKGGNALADRELLAILLGSGSRGMSAVELASRVISTAAISGNSRVPSHIGCSAFRGRGRRRPPRSPRPFISSAARRTAPVHYASPPRPISPPWWPRSCGSRQRSAWSWWSRDAGGGVLRQLVLTEGGSDHTSLPVRDVITAVLTSGGAAFGLAHNHPSGSVDPSPADVVATDHLRRASDIVGLTFLDHLVVTDTKWCRVS